MNKPILVGGLCLFGLAYALLRRYGRKGDALLTAPATEGSCLNGPHSKDRAAAFQLIDGNAVRKVCVSLS
jgi:hypothetical protein